MSVVESLVEVKLPASENFLKIKETLTRIGIASKANNRLYQSCHILHKQGRYYITHFKELFALDGKMTNFSVEDMGRRNRIVQLLEEWKLLTVVDKERIKDPLAPLSQIKVIAFRDKKDWELISKYSIGKVKNV